MALPAGNTAWPPKEYAPAYAQVQRDSAWLNGDMASIRDQIDTGPKPYQARAQYNGGIIGATARGVLGKPDPGGSASIERHLPVASELVTKSANLMGKKPPSVTLHPNDEGNQPAADALAEITGSDRFAAAWWGAMWKAAGHGWVFGRVVWDTKVKPHPWIEWVKADQGYAEFSHGEQVAVTFWDTHPSPDKGKGIYRLLQRHAPGAIEYGLYKGTDTELGMRVPVTDHPKTEYLADLIDADSEVKTGTQRLTARMFRNLEENPAWENDPQLRYYGRSDVAKGGGLWADIDQGWTELWHEVESGRHRLLVSEELFETGAPGTGSYFQWHRDVFGVGASGNADAPPTIESVQPELRIDKHTMLVDTSIRKAVAAVGYSLMSVGLDPQASGQMTATETRQRQETTIDTVAGKARQARAEGGELFTALLDVDAGINGYTRPTRTVNVSLVEPVQDSELDEAQTIGILREKQLASIDYGVRRLHPEWTPEQQDAEIAEIWKELNMGMPADPFNVGADEPFDDGEPETPPSMMMKPTTPDEVSKAVTAATALFRAGFDNQDSLRAVGLDPIKHSGLLPVTLKTEKALESEGEE